MKTMGYKGMVIVLFSMFVVGVSAQSVLTLKVTNVPSAKGKLMAATDKGQYNMVDAAVSDVVLELKDVPAGKCKIYAITMKTVLPARQRGRSTDGVLCHCRLGGKRNTETVVVPLVDVRKGMKK